MAQKKKMGKNQRDRIKKRNAKKQVAVISPCDGLQPGPTSCSSNDTKRLPRGLIDSEAIYSNVDRISAIMNMAADVSEEAHVDEKGRKLRVIMGGQKEMKELSKRLEEEKAFQARLDDMSAKFNALSTGIFTSDLDQTKAKGKLWQVSDAIDGLLARMGGDLVNAQKAKFSVWKHPAQLKLVLARENPCYDFTSLKANIGLRRTLKEIEEKMATMSLDLEQGN